MHILRNLKILGLIEVDGWINTTRPPTGLISISDHWAAIQGALGFSLTDLARIASGQTMSVQPQFGVPAIRGHHGEIFVIMPFDEDLAPVYRDHIKKVVRRLRVPLEPGSSRMALVSVRRADDFFASNAIIQDVWQSICAAKIVIADCTRRNPNVFYELGIAHTVGTPTVLITQDKADVPFDIGHIRYIHYEYTPEGMKLFETTLRGTLYELLTADSRDP